MILLDTHVLLWLRSGDARLGASAQAEIQHAWESNELALSAISIWEVAMLHEKGCIRLPEDPSRWRKQQLDQGLLEIPADGDMGISASGLKAFHPDTADRIIVATALDGHVLVTADDRILSWNGDLKRLDARM